MRNMKTNKINTKAREDYLWAFDAYLGMKECVGPIKVFCNDVIYTFDFYDPESKTLIAIANKLDDTTVSELIKTFPHNLLLIVDASIEMQKAHAGREKCDPIHFYTGVLAYASDIGAFVYADNEIWEYDPEFQWVPMITQEELNGPDLDEDCDKDYDDDDLDDGDGESCDDEVETSENIDR